MASAAPARPRLRINRPPIDRRFANRDNEIHPGSRCATSLDFLKSYIAERANREHRAHTRSLFLSFFHLGKIETGIILVDDTDLERLFPRFYSIRDRGDWNFSPPPGDVGPHDSIEINARLSIATSTPRPRSASSQQRGDLHYLLNSNMELIMITKLARGKHAKMATASLAATHTHARYQHACPQYGDAWMHSRRKLHKIINRIGERGESRIRGVSGSRFSPISGDPSSWRGVASSSEVDPSSDGPVQRALFTCERNLTVTSSSSARRDISRHRVTVRRFSPPLRDPR